jgi:hypothetical protein
VRKEEHRVAKNDRATQLRANYIDDEVRRGGRWRSRSQPAKACFPLAVDSVCPYRGNRESGRRYHVTHSISLETFRGNTTSDR